MIGQSQSGTGKTAAFTLAMLSRVNFELDAVQVSSWSYFSENVTSADNSVRPSAYPPLVNWRGKSWALLQTWENSRL